MVEHDGKTGMALGKAGDGPQTFGADQRIEDQPLGRQRLQSGMARGGEDPVGIGNILQHRTNTDKPARHAGL